MLANSEYARKARLYNERMVMKRPSGYSLNNWTSFLRGGLTRVRVPIHSVTRVRVPVRVPVRAPVYRLSQLRFPRPYARIGYTPFTASGAANVSLLRTLFSSWIGKLIIGLIIGGIIIAAVVGTVVPLTVKDSSSSSSSSNSGSGSGSGSGSTSNPSSTETTLYFLPFNISNSSLSVGNITDPNQLSYMQGRLDEITTANSDSLSPCRLQLSYAEVTKPGTIVAATTLQCNVFCTGTCVQNKTIALQSIISESKYNYDITDFPEMSNRSLRLARSALAFGQTEKASPGSVIDGRKVAGIDGLVVSVSFFADHFCNGHMIEFGAFQIDHHEQEHAQFVVTAGSGPLIINKVELLPSTSLDPIKLITIDLCSMNNDEEMSIDRECQGIQFPIKSHEYLGSYSTHCSLASVKLEKSDDAYTYINTKDGNAFNKPLRHLRYQSLAKQDIVQEAKILPANLDNKIQRNEQQEMNMRKVPRVLFLGTYPPRGCGLATFLHDVVINYDKRFGTNSRIIAIDEKTAPIDRVYPTRVIARLNQTERDSHLDIAKLINQLDDVDVLNIQHEFGLFGGQAGEWILHLISSVKKPVIVTFHTVLQDPASIYYSITRAICSSVSEIIVLSNAGRDILVKNYQIDINKINVVPHGIPDVPFLSTLPMKHRLDFDNRITMATFGLIGRSKGLEYSIRAMKLAVTEAPNLLYIILGATHPVILKEVGEEYRNQLQTMINNFNLTNNVKLVNKYLDNNELLSYLSAIDIYLTPYPNPDQVVSGTLSIAVGCGKAVISTPYIYAKELLANGRGFLVPFTNDTILSKTIVRLANDDKLRDRTRRKAYKYGRKMIWARVVMHFATIYENALLNY